MVSRLVRGRPRMVAAVLALLVAGAAAAWLATGGQQATSATRPPDLRWPGIPATSAGTDAGPARQPVGQPAPGGPGTSTVPVASAGSVAEPARRLPTAGPTTAVRPVPTGTDPAPTTSATTGPTPKASPSVYYKNCAKVRAAGAAPLYRGEPGYSAKLDKDGDGVACDK